MVDTITNRFLTREAEKNHQIPINLRVKQTRERTNQE